MGSEHGRGGISRRKDGRLQVRITLPNGKRIVRMVPAMEDGRAQRRLAERLQRELIEARENDLNPSAQTVAAYLRSWLGRLGEGDRAKVRPRTREFYTMIVENHIIPTLGHYRLDRLGERHVQAWLDTEPGSVQSVRHYRSVLRNALSVAKRQRLIAHNPAIEVDVAKPAEFVGDPLTFDEAHALFRATDRLAALWRLAIISGLRQGELLGLAWENVDLEAGAITVTTQLQLVNGSWVSVPTKTDRTIERMSIDPETVGVLRAHKLRQAAERQPDWPYWGLVFVTTRGRPIARSDALRAFHGACDAAGVKRRRFHDLRGTSSTLLSELGVEEDVRMARLGHATRAVHRHYTKASEAMDREAVRRLAEAIG